MIKRMNKLTALLVAATAVASIVPATGVNAADYQRIESKDGSIYSAVAYKDGKFFVDGNIKDEETDAAYYLNGGKFSDLENIDTGVDVNGTYADKYLSVEGGDYYIDLETGKVSDEDLAEDNLDDLAVALRKAIKDKADDRYTTEHSTLKTTSDFTLLDGAKFADAWYGVQYDGKNLYTDIKGNYIDADYNLGKIKVEVTTGSSTKSVNLNNTEDKEDSITAGQEVGAKITASDVIGQDANYIYRTATIELTAGTDSISKINNVAVTPASTVSFKVIQKISKAQASDDIDGAKYAKTVANYAITDEAGVDATAKLTGMSFNVVGGKLIAYKTTTASGLTTFETREVKFSTERGYTYTEIEDANTEKDAVAFDIDADGNMWMLKSGFVYKFDNVDEWNKVYKVDGSMNEMSVYNKDNMVVWNEKDEVYSVIGNKEEEKPVEVTKGWVQAADGTWTYVKEDGTKATGWLNLNGAWYFLNNSGVMQTGWVQSNGAWYFLQSSGAMKTGWINDRGTWYYANTSGAMQTGWVNVNGTWYFLNASGAMQTGWINDRGTWYFTNASGAMLSNTTVNGYKLGANGAWIR
ncbi:N-acetylmuramoyl-L-alanine amidase family protein [Clostridium weizhouense]|uniref:N-acetylmuramoyl-L-alanine amidase family protein n=1 Tax=Clostridium weizhouense TaxID=2859781 RepID=A0ABS7AP44_9CLOT|nr:N-acetylmuramoyl-L-alanine amidase family protein [Clostridium weizhouense]MBW6410314.1 N-acetylmuramoyl-L-alanine amidase family protein [Clostridium weizhouense]